MARESIQLSGEVRSLALQLHASRDDAYEALVARGSEATAAFLWALQYQSNSEDTWSLAVRRAIEGLGRLRAREAVPHLLARVAGGDWIARLKAIWALGEIGDREAIRPLIPCLGQRQPASQSLGSVAMSSPGGMKVIRWTVPVHGEARSVFKVRTCEVAGEALYKLGEGPLVASFEAAMQTPSPLRPNGYRKEIIAALINAVETASAPQVVNALRVLVALAAFEAIPALRGRAGPLGFATNRVRKHCLEAISQLEYLQTLPRPASNVPATDTLPSPAGGPTPATTTLPRPS